MLVHERLKEIMEKGTWEDLLIYIVEVEKLDAEKLDLIKFIDSFLSYIKIAKELDFRIPAKVLYIAVLLLKLKFKIFFEEKQEEKEIIEIPKIDLSKIEISIPIKRFPIAHTTLQDLILALRKVLEQKEKKEIRKIQLSSQKERFKFKFEEAEKYILETENKINELLKNKEKIEFKEILNEFSSEEIALRLFCVLNLEMKNKIQTFQEAPFKEIWIYK